MIATITSLVNAVNYLERIEDRSMIAWYNAQIAYVSEIEENNRTLRAVCASGSITDENVIATITNVIRDQTLDNQKTIERLFSKAISTICANAPRAVKRQIADEIVRRIPNLVVWEKGEYLRIYVHKNGGKGTFLPIIGGIGGIAKDRQNNIGADLIRVATALYDEKIGTWAYKQIG